MIANVNLRALELALGGLRGASDLTLVVEYQQDELPATAVQGADVILASRIEVPFVGGATTEPVALESSESRFYARFSILRGDELLLVRDVIIPSGGDHDFGDLEPVDPETFAPLPAVPPSVQELLEDARDTLVDVKNQGITASVSPLDARCLRVRYPAHVSPRPGVVRIPIG